MSLSNQQPWMGAGTRPESERRSHERINVHLPLTLNYKNGAGNIEESSLSRDLSISGAYCYIRHPLQVGDPIEVHIAPGFRGRPNHPYLSAIAARVVRINGCSGFGMMGIGLQFNGQIPSL
jgi:PilZ domain